jgi:hypothetical protein
MYVHSALGIAAISQSWQGKPLRFFPLHPFSQSRVKLGSFELPREPETTTKIKRDKRLPETRVTSAELETVKQRAREAGKSFSDFQREALLNGVVVVRQNAVDRAAVAQLLAIGKNLNQLTRKTHIHDEYDRQRLHDILNTIEGLAMGLIDGS